MASIDAMTQAMKAALDAELARLLAPVVRGMERPVLPKRPDALVRATPFGLHAHSRRRREGVPEKPLISGRPFDSLSSEGSEQ
jgi:hypothetical protein